MVANDIADSYRTLHDGITARFREYPDRSGICLADAPLDLNPSMIVKVTRPSYGVGHSVTGVTYDVEYEYTEPARDGNPPSKLRIAFDVPRLHPDDRSDVLGAALHEVAIQQDPMALLIAAQLQSALVAMIGELAEDFSSLKDVTDEPGAPLQ